MTKILVLAFPLLTIIGRLVVRYFGGTCFLFYDWLGHVHQSVEGERRSGLLQESPWQRRGDEVEEEAERGWDGMGICQSRDRSFLFTVHVWANLSFIFLFYFLTVQINKINNKLS
jgi:hypothetical protein